MYMLSPPVYINEVSICAIGPAEPFRLALSGCYVSMRKYDAQDDAQNQVQMPHLWTCTEAFDLSVCLDGKSGDMKQEKTAGEIAAAWLWILTSDRSEFGCSGAERTR